MPCHLPDLVYSLSCPCSHSTASLMEHTSGVTSTCCYKTQHAMNEFCMWSTKRHIRFHLTPPHSLSSCWILQLNTLVTTGTWHCSPFILGAFLNTEKELDLVEEWSDDDELSTEGISGHDTFCMPSAWDMAPHRLVLDATAWVPSLRPGAINGFWTEHPLCLRVWPYWIQMFSASCYQEEHFNWAVAMATRWILELGD
jgi:hypothetical protein